MSLDDYTIIGPLTYRGKKDCDSVICTRRFIDGKMEPDCWGWHCVYCDEPCSYQGHKCPASEAILGESARIVKEARDA